MSRVLVVSPQRIPLAPWTDDPASDLQHIELCELLIGDVPTEGGRVGCRLCRRLGSRDGGSAPRRISQLRATWLGVLSPWAEPIVSRR